MTGRKSSKKLRDIDWIKAESSHDSYRSADSYNAPTGDKVEGVAKLVKIVDFSKEYSSFSIIFSKLETTENSEPN